MPRRPLDRDTYQPIPKAATKKIECRFAEWRHGGWGFGGAVELLTDERIRFKLIVGDCYQILYINDEPRQGLAFSWPVDCHLRIWAERLDFATIHSCSFRPLTDQDVADCKWATPPITIPGDPTKTMARLSKLSAGYASTPKPSEVFAVKTSGTPMMWVSSGTFDMGSRDARDEGRHPVQLTKGYWIAQTEVTQKEFEQVTGTNPSRIKGSPYLPVDWVSWDQAMGYCKTVTDREREAGRLPTGYEYRLPTDAEWEFACRAGSDDDFSIPLEAVWCRTPEKAQPHEVAESLPNKWGLYDMHGNAMEWCLDGWSDHPRGKKEVTIDPFTPPRRGERDTFVVRGGGWWAAKESCSSHWRNKNQAHANAYRGFRIVLGRVLTDQIPAAGK